MVSEENKEYLENVNSDDDDGVPSKKPRFKKKRGQNRSRPLPFKEDRSVKLCKTLINGNPEDVKNCPFEKCSFLHDIEKFLKEKSNNIGDTCFIYTTRGYCMYGLTCRFSACHLDENNRNMKADNYDENPSQTTFNQIGNDLQVKLRKKAYDFSSSKKIIAKIEDDIQDEKIIKKEDSKSGCTPDLAEIQQILEGKRVIDFRNKLFLSPLTTVGNLPFRRICKEYGADITCGEMACALPIINGSSPEWALTKRHKSEDIFGVQLCGNKPSLIVYAVQLLKENTSIDFIDLNLGCPIELIYRQGGGSALLRKWNQLEVIIKSCSRILDGKPFTVKTRTGIYADKNVAHELVPKFEKWGASLVTVHGRSREQRYTKTADWNYIEKCAKAAENIPIIGNGDILCYEDYNESQKLAPSISGIMIGRGALIKPWLFQEIKEQKTLDPSSKERYELLQKFVNYGLEHWGSDTKGVENTRKFLLEWQSFLYRYVPYGILVKKPQKINERADCLDYRDDMEKLMASPNCADWIKLSEMLLGPVPEGFQFLPKHKANSY